MLKSKYLVALGLLAFASLAHAQSNARVVASCGTASGGIVGFNAPLTVDQTGTLCTVSGGGGGGGTVTQGTAAADSGSWPVHLVFGTTALALGQALSAASVPVVLPAAQITTLTPPTSVTVTQATGTNLHVVIDSGTVTPGPATAVAPVVGGSAISSLVLKGSAGALTSVYATCSAACYLMVFNATAAPSNGATTSGIASSNMQECAGPSTNPNISYGGLPPSAFSTGITAVISSTGCATLTLATTGFVHGTVQ